MCMEDVRIGRETNATDIIVVVASTPTQLVGGSSKRYCLIFSPPTAGRITIGRDSNHVSDGGGLVLAAGCDPLVLTIQDHGDLVRGPWYAANDGTSRTVGVAWSILERE